MSAGTGTGREMTFRVTKFKVQKFKVHSVTAHARCYWTCVCVCDTQQLFYCVWLALSLVRVAEGAPSHVFIDGHQHQAAAGNEAARRMLRR